jgi:hypothetical protein
LDDEAVALLTEFEGYPLFWLGETFQGFQLSGAQVSGNSVTVTYGGCTLSEKELRSEEGGSCVFPIAIIIDAPGAIPGPEGIPDQPSALPHERGLVAWHNQSATTLWVAGSVAITVFSNPDDRSDAIDALRTSNHNALRIDPIREGAVISLE